MCIKVLSDNSLEPRPCLYSKRANFQPWKFLGQTVLSERGEQIKGGRGGAGGRGSGREGFSYTRIWSSVIKSSRETSGEQNCQEKGGARISAAFFISACGQADLES